MDLPPALVLSGHMAAMGAVRCLGLAGIPVIVVHYAESDFAHRSRYVSVALRSPHPEEDPDGFLDVLRDAATRYGRGLLIPANDATLGQVSRHRDVLLDHHEVAANAWAVTERILDKRHTYELAAELGIPAPRTASPTSRDDAAEVASTFRFPCLIKPRVSHRYVERFGQKLARVEDATALLAEYDRTAAAGIEVLIQEYIPGDARQGWLHDVYRADGSSVEFTAQKIRLTPPEFGLARAIVSRRRPDLSEPVERLLDALGYHGYACTEFKVDPRDGIPKFMEVNGRVNRTVAHPLAAGLNYPALIYRHRMLGEAPVHPGPSDRRVYWVDIASDLRYAWPGLRTEPGGIRAYLRPYLGPTVFSVGDGLDLGPVLARSFGTVGARWRRVRRRLGRVVGR